MSYKALPLLLLVIVIASCGHSSNLNTNLSQPIQIQNSDGDTGDDVAGSTALHSVIMRPQEPEEFDLKGASMLNPAAILTQIEAVLDEKEAECTGGGLYMAGGNYEDDPAAVNLAQTGTYSDQGNFTPSYVAGDLDTASYGFYVWGIRGFAGQQTIGFNWVEGNELESASDCWVGLGNLTKDTWDWYRYPQDTVLSIPSFGPYRSASGHVLMAFVLLGDQPATLDYMEIGVPEMRATGADGLPEETPDYPLLGPSGSLPAAFDLSEDCSPINDQMSWGSCTAFAVGDGAYNYELGFMYGQLGWDFTIPRYKVSPKHLYVVSGELQGFPPGGGSGRYTEQVIGDLVTNGVATELNAPYDLIYNNTWTTAALADAQVLTIERWEEIPCNTWEGINTVKQVIAQQRKVLPMQAYLDNSFFDYQVGMVWYPIGYFAGGHAMCIVGYDDARGTNGAFKVRNSWSEYWGDNGHVWIAYEAFLSPSAAIRAWTIYEDYSQDVVDHFGLTQVGEAPVTVLSATDGTRADGIGLSWNASASGTIYTIYRDQQDNEVGTSTTASWLDTSISDSYGHVYWVRANSSALCAPDTGYLASTPSIEAVNPDEGVEGDEVVFSAAGLGSAPLQYSWNFGGGADPNTSSDSRPTVTLGSPGEYNASLTLTNSLGSDTFQFTLTVAGVQPVIQSIQPHSGYSGNLLEPVPNVNGSPSGYSWNFGGGATPNTSTAEQPSITLGMAGHYEATLTISSEWGDDIFYFTLVVLDESETAWPMAGHDSRHSGQSPVMGPQTNNVKWKFFAGTPDALPAACSTGNILIMPDNDLIFSTSCGNFAAVIRRLNPDGTEQWSKWHYDELYFTYYVEQLGRYSGNFYYHSTEGLFAVDPETGEERWHYDGEAGGKPIDEDSAGRLWLVGSNYIFALYTNDGTIASEPILIGNRNVSATGVLAPNGLLFTCCKNTSDSYLLAFDTESETPVGTMWVSGNVNGLTLSPDGYSLYITSSNGGVRAIDTQNCKSLWGYKPSAKWNDPRAMADGTVLSIGKYGDLIALNPDSGELLWTLDLMTTDYCTSHPAIGRDGMIYCGGSDRKVYAIKDGSIQWTSLEATSETFGAYPVLGPDGTLYAADDAGWIWAFGEGGTGEERVPAYAYNVTPSEGNEGDVVSFGASVQGSGTLDYAWDFGGGATPSTSSDPNPVVTLGSGGYHDCELVVSNTYGSYSLHFQLHIIGAASGWTTYDLATDLSSSSQLQMSLIDGKPAVAFVQKPDNDIYYAYSATAVPTSASDWSICMIVDNDGASASSYDVMEFQNVPVVRYFINPPKIWLGIANSPTPTAVTDWSLTTVYDKLETGYIGMNYGDLLIVDGRLTIGNMIQDYSSSETDSYVFSRANVAIPTGISDWSHHEVFVVDELKAAKMLIYNGVPVVARYQYYPAPREVSLYTSTLAVPTQSSDWKSHVVTPTESNYDAGQGLDIAVVSGRLAIGYHWSYTDGTRYTRYARAQVDNPVQTSDWDLHTLFTDEAFWTDVTVVDYVGKPWMFYSEFDDHTLNVATSNIAEPQQGSDWTLGMIDTTLDSGNQITPIVVGSNIVIAYYVYDEVPKLRIAVYQP